MGPRLRGDDNVHRVALYGVAASAARLKCSSMRGQPPSTSLRILAPPSAPMRSNLRCSSSTSVACGPSATNLTSTSELTVRSGFQLLLRSQLMTKRCGGSHTSTLPTSACEPSSLNSYQRPPRRDSMTTAFIGGLPIVALRGHQRSSPDRKSTRLNSSHLGISYAVF